MKALLLLLLTAVQLGAAEPSREDGLSVYMLPDRVAKIKGGSGGFTVDGTTYEEAKELLAYFQKLPKAKQENGIWIVTTGPTAYSDAEQVELKTLMTLCTDKGIPLFTCRGSQLPDGWTRAK